MYEKQLNTIQSFGPRIKSQSDNYDINLDDIASQIVVPENPAGIRSATSEFSAMYADRSKDGDRVASTVVFGQHVYSL